MCEAHKFLNEYTHLLLYILIHVHFIYTDCIVKAYGNAQLQEFMLFVGEYGGCNGICNGFVRVVYCI